MNINMALLVAPLLLAGLLSASSPRAEKGGTNVVVLLADDLGFGDPHYQGGRAETRSSSTASTVVARCAPRHGRPY